MKLFKNFIIYYIQSSIVWYLIRYSWTLTSIFFIHYAATHNFSIYHHSWYNNISIINKTLKIDSYPSWYVSFLLSFLLRECPVHRIQTSSFFVPLFFTKTQKIVPIYRNILTSFVFPIFLCTVAWRQSNIIDQFCIMFTAWRFKIHYTKNILNFSLSLSTSYH